MTEDQLLANVRELCQSLGVATYHTHRSDRSEPGFPDLVLVGQRAMYRELKSGKGKTTARQDWWLQLLSEAGHDADVWRPADWPDRIVAEIRSLGRAPAPPPLTQAELKKRLGRRARRGAEGGASSAPTPVRM